MIVELLDPDTLALVDVEAKLISPEVEILMREDNQDGTVSVTLPWTYRNMKLLSDNGVRVPSTIMRDYKYTKLLGKYAPFTHQEQISEFLSLNDRAYCFGGMGVGKTASAVWAAEYLVSIGEVKRVLIVCTKSTMVPAWGDTLFSLAMGRAYTLLRGSRAQRKARAKEDTVYHIINHDGLQVCAEELAANRYDLIILDESTAFKTAGIRRWKHAKAVCDKAKRVWALTGSPTPKSPEDAFGQIRLVTPNRAPSYKTTWRNMTMQQVSMYKWNPRPDAKEVVFAAMQPAIHIRKEDVLKNQPETVKVLCEVDTTSEQNRMLLQLKRSEVITAKDGSKITPVHAAAALTKHMQILLGAVYDDEGKVAYVDNTERIAEVIRLIEAGRESGIGTWDAPLGKTIVAVPYRHVLELYKEQLDAAGYKVGVIHGGVADKARDTAVRLFQTTQDIEVLLVIPDAIAHGLTLTAANTFIWCSPLVKPEIFQQANERMDRPGQVQRMTQARIYANSIERKYYEVMDSRQDWQNGLLNLYTEMLQSE